MTLCLLPRFNLNGTNKKGGFEKIPFFSNIKYMSNFVLNKGQLNNTVVTVSERSQLLTPFFLIVFTNKFSTSEVVEKCSLQSSYSNSRYDLLEITEQSAPNPLLGQIHLITGEWSYVIYESTSQTLEISETTGRVLQQGLTIVKD